MKTNPENCPPDRSRPSGRKPCGDNAAPKDPTVANSAFHGTENTVTTYNDGALIQHSQRNEDGSYVHVFSFRGGPFELRSLPQLSLQVLLGPCTITVGGNDPQPLPAGGTLEVPPGSIFTVEADGQGVIIAIAAPEPGLGSPGGGSTGGIGGVGGSAGGAGNTGNN